MKWGSCLAMGLIGAAANRGFLMSWFQGKHGFSQESISYRRLRAPGTEKTRCKLLVPKGPLECELLHLIIRYRLAAIFSDFTLSCHKPRLVTSYVDSDWLPGVEIKYLFGGYYGGGLYWLHIEFFHGPYHPLRMPSSVSLCVGLARIDADGSAPPENMMYRRYGNEFRLDRDWGVFYRLLCVADPKRGLRSDGVELIIRTDVTDSGAIGWGWNDSRDDQSTDLFPHRALVNPASIREDILPPIPKQTPEEKELQRQREEQLAQDLQEQAREALKYWEKEHRRGRIRTAIAMGIMAAIAGVTIYLAMHPVQ